MQCSRTPAPNADRRETILSDVEWPNDTVISYENFDIATRPSAIKAKVLSLFMVNADCEMGL